MQTNELSEKENKAIPNLSVKIYFILCFAIFHTSVLTLCAIVQQSRDKWPGNSYLIKTGERDNMIKKGNKKKNLAFRIKSKSYDKNLKNQFQAFPKAFSVRHNGSEQTRPKYLLPETG